MGMPLLRKQGSGYHECGKAYLRLYRHPVLESGKDPGNQGTGTSFVEDGKQIGKVNADFAVLRLEQI